MGGHAVTMLRLAGGAALRVAARTQPAGLLSQAARLAVPRNFAKLPKAVPQQAIRLDQPRSLHDELVAATDDKTARKLQKMTESIAKRLREPGFVVKLVAFRDLHGLTDPQLVTLCNRNSVAFRLGGPEFTAAMKALRVDYGMNTKQLVTFMNDGTAARLGKPDFDAAMKALFAEYDMSTEQLVTFMCDGVAARL